MKTKAVISAFANYAVKLSLASKKEKIEWLKQHAAYCIDCYGEKKGLVLMRKVAHYYVKDFSNAAKIRCMINAMTTFSDFNNMIGFVVKQHSAVGVLNLRIGDNVKL